MTADHVQHVVAVDDDERTLRLLVDALASDTCRVLTFDGGEVALSYLVEVANCDLLILDLEMPGTDGFAVARSVRRLAHLASMPILALTGMTGPDVAVRILEAGADAYLGKPVDLVELRTVVARLLSQPRERV